MTHSILMRAYLLARGQDVTNAFAGDPASSVTVSFPIRNTGTFTATSVDVVLPVRLGYWGQDYRAQVPVELAPGAIGQVVATLPTPPVMRGVHSWTQVGLYHLKVTVKTTNGLQYAVPGPFVYVRSPVVPPALAGSLKIANATVNGSANELGTYRLGFRIDDATPSHYASMGRVTAIRLTSTDGR